MFYCRLYGGAGYKPFCWAEWCLASIFALNALYHITRYTWANLSLRPILLSPKQRRLLGVSEDDPLFRNELPASQKACEPMVPLNLSCISFNRRMSLGSTGLSESSMTNIFLCIPVFLKNIFHQMYINFVFKRTSHRQIHFLNMVVLHRKNQHPVLTDRSTNLSMFRQMEI